MTKGKNLTSEEAGGSNRRRIHLREISGEADSPLETVGQDLRAARLRRGDDLATVSKALKIRKDHLEALEEDRFEALPGRTYAVGFVRTYAEYLGLDVTQCVGRFKAEIQGRHADEAPAVTVIDEDEQRKIPAGWKIIAGILLLLLLYGAYYLAVSRGQVLSQQPVDDVPEQIAANPPAPPPAPEVTSPIASVPADPAASVPPNGDAAAQSVSANAETPPQGIVYGEGNTNARVVLRARQAARILVQGADGTVYARRTLQPGDSYKVPNIVGVTLTTSNAGSIQIDLDGAPVGLAGTGEQEVIEALSLDPQSIVDRSGSGRRPSG